jgi:hypothetical protein
VNGYGFAMVLTLSLAACGGGGLSGAYTPSGGYGFFEKMNFTSKNKVEITFMGQVREIGYETDGKTLTIINPNAGETQIFTIDNAGCFDGGGLIGKYCRADGMATALAGRGLAGTWEAKAPGGSFRLTFAADNKVKLTVADDGGTPESQDASYEVSGNQVTVSAPGGVPIQLTRNGQALVGNFGGVSITFTQR